MSRLDYSKWDHIEISDDEDDTHPNIDTPSLFRWRHQARVDRMAEREKEKDTLAKEKESIEAMRKELMKQALSDEEKKVAEDKVREQEAAFQKKEEELGKKEMAEPWNVDTICKEGFSKSLINKTKQGDGEGNLTDEEQMSHQRKYTAQHAKELKTFGMMTKIDESQKYLVDHPFLVNEKAANFLAIWCIDLQVEKKYALVEIVSHQTMLLQFILELAKTLKVDPRNCFISFFEKFKKADESYLAGFNAELKSFIERVKERARIRIQDAVEEIEREEKEKRMGPGGLDPHEVFESLPKSLQDCFEKRDTGMLQKVIGELDPEEAKIHMKRCIDSGLWVPGGADKDEPENENEETYESVDTDQSTDTTEKQKDDDKD